MKLLNAAKNFAKNEDGAALVEYVTIIALVVAAATVGLAALGTQVNGAFNSAATGLQASLAKASW